MCGYIGLFGGNLKTEKIRYELKKALNAFKYRGPDESFINEISSCIIGFNRLSINHLDKGKQPIIFRNSGSFRKILICFNGEIFNHKSLEKDFLKGPFIRDEISILAELFSKFGLEFVKLLNGQFSISIVDSNTNKIYLIRDPFGIRPLFYSRNKEQDKLIFGSDINSLFKLGVDKIVNEKELARVHLTWSSSKNKTIWENIFQVPQGKIIVGQLSDKNLIQINEFTYWNWPEKIASSNKLDKKLTKDDQERFLHEIRGSIFRQCMSEVGITSYLSGGVDSSVLAYELSKMKKNLKTFSVSFRDKNYDESYKQKLLIDNIKCNHHFLRIEDEDISKNFKEACNFIQQPFFRTAPIPLFLLSKLVKKSGNKVVITGEGADEMLLGYDIFREADAVSFFREKPESLWRYKIFDKLYSYLPQYRNPRYRKLAIDTLLREGDFKILNPLKSRLSNNFRTLKCFKNSETLSSEIIDSLISDYEENAKYELDNIDIIQLFEIENLLSGYLLSSQGDRVSMANSVESRYPYLDIDFVNYTFQIPRQHKLKSNFFKRILRKSYADLLPPEIINAPKIAYQAPEARAILNSEEILNSLLNENNKVYDFYSYKRIIKIIDRVQNTDSRGGFGDNMSLSILSSLSILLDGK